MAFKQVLNNKYKFCFDQAISTSVQTHSRGNDEHERHSRFLQNLLWEGTEIYDHFLN